MPRLLLLLKSEGSIEDGRYRAWWQPTMAQLRSGRYPKPLIKFAGLHIAIETPAGTVRRGVGWEKRLPFAYGEFVGTLGTDGDPVDVFVGLDEQAPIAWVVRAQRYGRWSEYDEDKVMVGFQTADDAKRAFLLGYTDERFYGGIEPISMVELPVRLQACRGKRLTGSWAWMPASV